MIRTLGPASYFGERSLLTDEPRSASVIAEDDVHVLRVDQKAFVDLLGPIHLQLTKRLSLSSFRRKSGDSVSGQSQRFSLSRFPAGSGAASQLKQHVEFSNLRAVKNLGSGGYGRVIMVRDVASRQLYALKMVRKKNLLKVNGELNCERMLRERNVRRLSWRARGAMGWVAEGRSSGKKS